MCIIKGAHCWLTAAAMDGKSELPAGPVAGSTAGGKGNSRAGYWKLIESQLRVLRGCLAGVAAVALVTFCAFRLNLNLSASGSLYFLIVVMVSRSEERRVGKE